MRRRWGRGHRYKRHPREGSGRGVARRLSRCRRVGLRPSFPLLLGGRAPGAARLKDRLGFLIAGVQPRRLGPFLCVEISGVSKRGSRFQSGSITALKSGPSF